MTPAAYRLAIEHLSLALDIASRESFPDDPDLEKSIALEALCEAAISFPGGTFPGWLATIISRRITDEKRYRYGRRGEKPIPYPLYEEDMPLVTDNTKHIEDREYTVQLLRSLPARHRQVAVLRAHGLTQKEVGEWLGITDSRVSQIEREMRLK